MEFIHLRSFSNYIEANIAVSMLEEEGIRCHTIDENSSTILGVPSGVRLMVYKAQAERATEILINTEAAYLRTLECPRCKHIGFEIREVPESHEAALRKMPFGRWTALLSKLFTKEGTTSIARQFICKNCQKEFDELP